MGNWDSVVFDGDVVPTCRQLDRDVSFGLGIAFDLQVIGAFPARLGSVSAEDLQCIGPVVKSDACFVFQIHRYVEESVGAAFARSRHALHREVVDSFDSDDDFVGCFVHVTELRFGLFAIFKAF